MTQGIIWNILGADDVDNPLDAGFIFLFSGSVFVNNIMEKWKDGYAWNCQDMDIRSNRLDYLTPD